MASTIFRLSAKRGVRLSLATGMLAVSIFLAGHARAQQAPGQAGPDFDPVTRAFSSKNPPPTDPNAKPVPPPLTAEQQAALDEQKRQAQIQQIREDSKKKHEAAMKAEKDKEAAERKADQDRIAARKAKNDARLAQRKEDQEKLKNLKQEEKDARKAYQEAKQTATGSTSQLDDDYRKAEADRQKQIRELQHPKYVPLDDKKSSTSGTTGNNTTTTSH